MTTERYKQVQQRNAQRLRLEEDSKAIPPIDCSTCTNKITDNSETEDNVAHGSASLQSYLSRDVDRLEKPLDCPEEELCSSLRHSGFKAICFHRKKFIRRGCRLLSRPQVDVLGQLAEEIL